MSIYNPPAGWFKAPTGAERLWVGLALAWCIVMSIAMPYWHFYGKQNSTGESYSVSIQDFGQRVGSFIEANKVGDHNGIPIVEVPPGGDGYLLARMWSFTPILQLKMGQTYRLHLSSVDLQHGFVCANRFRLIDELVDVQVSGFEIQLDLLGGVGNLMRQLD